MDALFKGSKIATVNICCYQVLSIKFVTLKRPLALNDMFLHAIQRVIMPGAKKKCSESDVKVAVGRISGGGWIVYEVSMESHSTLKERLLILSSGANFERGNAFSRDLERRH
jgi:hypothetical protein